MVDLKRRKLLFEAKTQPTNNSRCQGGDERHIMEVDGRMHSRNVKIANLVGKHLQAKEKTKMGGGG
jgi:hypothetical protein